MNQSPAAWVFNFGAEEELRSLRGGRPAPVSARAIARARSIVAVPRSLEAPCGLLTEGDHMLEDLETGIGFVGRAWCATPAALSMIEASGAATPAAPGVVAVTRGNARETFARHDPFEGTRTCGSVDEVEAALRGPREGRASGRAPAWILRSSLSTAGRDRLVVERAGAAVRRFVERSLTGGPIHVDPLVDIESEYALHGWLERGGRLERGAIVEQTARGGTWTGSRLAGTVAHAEAIQRAFESVAATLDSIGYFGPFGMDAFTWRDAAGELRIHAPSEVNARLTMSFALGAPELASAPTK